MGGDGCHGGRLGFAGALPLAGRALSLARRGFGFRLAAIPLKPAQPFFETDSPMFIFSTKQFRRTLLAVVLTGGGAVGDAAPTGLQQLRYGNPGLAVDLAVGLWAWPMPMDNSIT